MPMECQKFVFGYEKDLGRRERRKSKEFLVYRVGIKMEFIIEIKMWSISSVETGAPGEKQLLLKLRRFSDDWKKKFYNIDTRGEEEALEDLWIE